MSLNFIPLAGLPCLASMEKDALNPELSWYAKVLIIGGFHFSKESGRREYGRELAHGTGNK